MGDELDLEGLQVFADTSGYIRDDRVDEPGEIAFLGEVVDIFPAAEPSPFRISMLDGRIRAIRTYHPLTQRTLADVEALDLGPASELILPLQDERSLGLEHCAATFYGKLASVTDLLSDPAIARDPRSDARAASFEGQVGDAHEIRMQFPDGERPRALSAQT